MKRIIVLCAALIVGNVHAGVLDSAIEYVKEKEVSVFYGHRSKHWITKDYTNSEHNMVAVRVGNFAAGTFKNSYGRETWFAGVYGEKKYGNLSLFGIAGAMRGYTKCYGEDGSNSNVCPVAAFGVSYNLGTKYLQPTLYQLGDATVDGFRIDLK